MFTFAGSYRGFIYGLGGALFILLVGCTQVAEPPLRVGTNIWLGYEPLYLARSLGYVNPEHVRLVEYVSATQVMRGLVDGAVEAAALTLDEALLLQQKGVDARIVLVMDYSAGADALLSKPDINSLQDLRGKRVGVETTSLGAYLMQRILDKSGLSVNDLKVISLEHSRHEQAYVGDEVDAVVTFDPVRSRLLSKGAKVLLDTRELPGEVVDVLVIREDALRYHKTHMKALLDSWFKALTFFEQQPRAAVRLMLERMKLDEEKVLDSFKGVKLPAYDENRRLLLGAPSALQKQAQALAVVMQSNRLLSGGIYSVNSMFNVKLMMELYP